MKLAISLLVVVAAALMELALVKADSYDNRGGFDPPPINPYEYRRRYYYRSGIEASKDLNDLKLEIFSSLRQNATLPSPENPSDKLFGDEQLKELRESYATLFKDQGQILIDIGQNIADSKLTVRDLHNTFNVISEITKGLEVMQLFFI